MWSVSTKCAVDVVHINKEKGLSRRVGQWS